MRDDATGGDRLHEVGPADLHVLRRRPMHGDKGQRTGGTRRAEAVHGFEHQPVRQPAVWRPHCDDGPLGGAHDIARPLPDTHVGRARVNRDLNRCLAARLADGPARCDVEVGVDGGGADERAGSRAPSLPQSRCSLVPCLRARSARRPR